MAPQTPKPAAAPQSKLAKSNPPPNRTTTESASEDAQVDEALSGTFPASDPPAFMPRHAGRDDKKAPLTPADAAAATARRPGGPIKH